MPDQPTIGIDEMIAAHGTAAEERIARLRTLSLRERGALIESACEAAAEIYASRLAAGLAPVRRAPWPASTWEFLKKHAAHFRMNRDSSGK